MKADRITEAFFVLLRSGMWGTPVNLTGCFPLSEEEWAALYRLAVAQTVEGLVFEGVQQLYADLLPGRELLTRWLVRVEKIAQRNASMNSRIAEQLAFFKAEGIEPLLLKGQGVALCYARAERRNCGDIDWYFRSRAIYRKANALIREKGFQINFKAGFSGSYHWKEYEVEHHSRMLDFHNPFCQAYLRSLREKEEERSVMVPFRESVLCMPSPLLQSLQVNVHILKHLLSFGIGIRQLCDAARIYFTYYGQLDGAGLRKIYSRTGIEQWVYLLHDVLVRFIGLPEEKLPVEIRKMVPAEWMMEDMLAAGNFGFHYTADLNRRNVRGKKRLWQNTRRYLPFAALEACSFPVVQFYSRFVH